MVVSTKPLALWLVIGLLGTASNGPLAAEEPAVRGLWVWKTSTVLAEPGADEALKKFCIEKGVNEVYVSIPNKGGASDAELSSMILLLHKSNVRVEALFGSTDADLPGEPREQMLNNVRAIVQFNQKNPKSKFDGIHLDIEPHQRPENKGEGNLQFLPNLVETFRAVRAIAEPAKLTLNVDIPNKILKGDASQRRLLATSVPRMTLMLYELNSPDDGKTTAQKVERLRETSEKYLKMAYEGLDDPKLARMVIALRVVDYGELMPDMFKSLEEAHRQNPRYLGWAWHSYNDHLKKGK